MLSAGKKKKVLNVCFLYALSFSCIWFYFVFHPSLWFKFGSNFFECNPSQIGNCVLILDGLNVSIAFHLVLFFSLHPKMHFMVYSIDEHWIWIYKTGLVMFQLKCDFLLEYNFNVVFIFYNNYIILLAPRSLFGFGSRRLIKRYKKKTPKYGLHFYVICKVPSLFQVFIILNKKARKDNSLCLGFVSSLWPNASPWAVTCSSVWRALLHPKCVLFCVLCR